LLFVVCLWRVACCLFVCVIFRSSNQLERGTLVSHTMNGSWRARKARKTSTYGYRSSWSCSLDAPICDVALSQPPNPPAPSTASTASAATLPPTAARVAACV
jgi:hypothetical protein